MRQVSAEIRVVVVHRTDRNLSELVKCERKYQRNVITRKSIFSVVDFVFLVFYFASEYYIVKIRNTETSNYVDKLEFNIQRAE